MSQEAAGEQVQQALSSADELAALKAKTAQWKRIVKQQIAEAEQKNTRLKEEVKRLSEKCESVGFDVRLQLTNEFGERMRLKEEENTRLKAEVESLGAENPENRSDRTAKFHADFAGEADSTLQGELERKETQIRVLQVLLETNQREFQEAFSAETDFTNAVAKLKEKNAKTISNLSSELFSKSASLQEARKTIDALIDDKSRLELCISELQDEAAQRERALEEALQVDSNRILAAQLGADVESAKSEAAQCRSAAEKLQQELAECKAELEQAHEATRQSVAENCTYSAQLKKKAESLKRQEDALRVRQREVAQQAVSLAASTSRNGARSPSVEGLGFISDFRQSMGSSLFNRFRSLLPMVVILVLVLIAMYWWGVGSNSVAAGVHQSDLTMSHAAVQRDLAAVKESLARCLRGSSEPAH